MNPRKKAAMLKAFAAFSARINARYEDAAVALRDDDYKAAMAILTELSQSHAKTSLSLRNALVRAGKLEDR